jgi:hypothetical protein
VFFESSSCAWCHISAGYGVTFIHVYVLDPMMCSSEGDIYNVVCFAITVTNSAQVGIVILYLALLMICTTLLAVSTLKPTKTWILFPLLVLNNVSVIIPNI